MNVYYNNAQADGQWDTLGNWWEDSTYTTPLTSNNGVPSAGDDAFIDGELLNGPSNPVVLNSIQCGTIKNDAFTVDLGNATASSYNFYNSVDHIGTTVFGGYGFYGNSSNSGTVESAGLGGEFTGNSVNNGNIGDSVLFSSNSSNSNTCLSDAVFNGNSYNTGTVVGDATFNTFTDLGGGEYEDTLGYGIGTVNGTVAGSGSQLYNIKYISNNMTGEIIATTYTVFQVTFNNDTTNNGRIDIASTTNFFNTSINQDDIIGNASFNDTSYNDTTGGFVGGNASFSNTSYNIGTVDGNATFAYILTAPIADDITGYASGIVGGDIYNSSAQIITTWRFTGAGSDLRSGATCQGNAIFKDTAGNVGTVTGDAYFDASSVKWIIKNASSFGGAIDGDVFLPFADILGTGLQ
jgi:hypothetical protein